FFFSSRRRHTRCLSDWSSDVCSSDLAQEAQQRERLQESDHRLSDLRQSGQKVQGELERLLERREQMGVQLRELAEEALRLDEERSEERRVGKGCRGRGGAEQGNI